MNERRNHYRVLYVQPEAPAEVIKAAYRVLMSTLRAHPDLGGDPEHAALLNAAYTVLSDPEARRKYDQSLRQQGRPAHVAPGAPTPATAEDRAPLFDPASWLADRCCPMCRERFAGSATPGRRCARCDSPLAPAPLPRSNHELVGRRAAERYARNIDVCLRLPGQPRDIDARLRDLSFTGLSVSVPMKLARGSALRVISPQFDAVARVIACRALPGGYSAHAQLLTLEMLRSNRGVFVDQKV